MITTSPPNSMNLIGAVGQAPRPGSRGSPTSATRCSGTPTAASTGRPCARRRRRSSRSSAWSPRSADGIVAVSEPIADEVRSFEPAGQVRVIPNGCDFDDFAGLEYHDGRALPDHAHGQLLRPAQPAAVPDRARRVGPRRRRRPLRRRLPRGRPRVGRGARPRRPARAARLRPAPRGARAAARLRGEPAAAARRRPAAAASSRPGRSSSTSPPSGRSWPRCRRTAPPPSSSARPARGSSSRPTTSAACARRSLGLHARWRAGKLADGFLSPEQRKRLSRETRVEELAELLWSLQDTP